MGLRKELTYEEVEDLEKRAVLQIEKCYYKIKHNFLDILRSQLEKEFGSQKQIEQVDHLKQKQAEKEKQLREKIQFLKVQSQRLIDKIIK